MLPGIVGPRWWLCPDGPRFPIVRRAEQFLSGGIAKLCPVPAIFKHLNDTLQFPAFGLMALGGPLVLDVTIIGGGLAGSTLATILARSNVNVALVESRREYPECFKAEKLEPDQWRLLQKHDLLQFVLPVSEQIDNVHLAAEGQEYGTVSIRQYGYLYHNLVNALRDHVPGSLDTHWSQALRIESRGDIQSVNLADGSTIDSRLVVISTGSIGRIHDQLGVKKRMISRQHSFHFGFNINNAQNRFEFEALTYHGAEQRRGIDYLTLFRIPGAMRANLFTYWKPGDERVRLLSGKPREMLLEYMPGLERVIGDFEVDSRVERFAIDLHVVDQAVLPGIVFAGDAFQSVCPATGTGLSKVLTDVDVLADLIVADWLGTAGMSTKKIRSYYEDQRKAEQDRNSLDLAIRRRRVAVEFSDLRYQIERIRNRIRIRRSVGRSARSITA
jgi:2-polyprenyl-6-methoxyphenol hydroxylase-like FAD-dependent oxidoreductase